MFRGFLSCRLARSPSRGILDGCFGGNFHAMSLKMKLQQQLPKSRNPIVGHQTNHVFLSCGNSTKSGLQRYQIGQVLS
jgi:hypothetical protein